MGIVSTLAQRGWLGALLGTQMNGNRDLYATFGWNRMPTVRNYILKYRRHPIARRVVDAYPNALWADPPIVSGDDAFNKAWQDLLAKQPVFASLQKLDKLCRMGKYAILVVGFDDGLSLDQPIRSVRDVSKGRNIIYLQPYSEASVDIAEYEQNNQSERYGMPTMYKVSPGEFNLDGTKNGMVKSIDQQSFKVHWSRVLHVAEGALESPVFGSSALEPIYNDLEDLEKVTGGASEIFWLNARAGLHINVDKEMELKEADAEALTEEIDEYSNNLRRVIRTRGVDVKSLGSDFINPANVQDGLLSNIAACTGIPKRVLSGSEAGQLASQQDRANWADRCGERVSEYGNPIMLIPFIRLCINAMVLPVPKQMVVTWPDMFKMNPLERAQTSAQMARSAANLAKTLFTVQQINHANAMDARPQPLITGGFGGGGFQAQMAARIGWLTAQASTDPTKTASGTSKTPSGAPPDVKGAGGKSGQPSDGSSSAAPTLQMQDALLPNAKTDLVLLTEDECRQIIGFGKHMPVFDDSQDSQASGSQVSEPTSAITAEPGVEAL